MSYDEEPSDAANDAANKKRVLPDWMTNPKPKSSSPKSSSPKAKAKAKAKPKAKAKKADDDDGIAGEWLGSEDSPPAPKRVRAISKKEKSFLDIRDDDDDDDDDNDPVLDRYGGSFIDDANVQDDDLPICKYGKACFRKNQQHLKEFSHPWKD